MDRRTDYKTALLIDAAIHEAASAQPTLTGMALMLNSTPSNTKASALLSAPGAMNCGTKARKKMAVFGLSRSTRSPARNTGHSRTWTVSRAGWSSRARARSCRWKSGHDYGPIDL